MLQIGLFLGLSANLLLGGKTGFIGLLGRHLGTLDLGERCRPLRAQAFEFGPQRHRGQTRIGRWRKW